MKSDAGEVDGRGISLFEIIVGADNQSNLLRASGSGSSLYGGKGEAYNTLQGGLGVDTFLHTNGAGLIQNCTTGDVVRFGAEYTGISFANDDIFIKSTEGDLIVQSIRNQVVEVTDGDGNFACHVMLSAGEGYLDGSSISGYKVLSGDRDVSNIIQAGNEGSSLYGGLRGADTLIGGNGEDCFMFGYDSGRDTIYSAYSNDYVNFMDITLDGITEISSTENQTKFSFISTGELTIDGNNGTGYMIQGKMYDVDLATNSLVERT